MQQSYCSVSGCGLSTNDQHDGWEFHSFSASAIAGTCKRFYQDVPLAFLIGVQGGNG